MLYTHIMYYKYITINCLQYASGWRPLPESPPPSPALRLHGRSKQKITPQAKCALAFAPAPPVSALSKKSARMSLGLILLYLAPASSKLQL